MIPNEKNPALDGYFGKAGPWKEVLAELRTLVRSCGLTEERKWHQPCYTFRGKNVAILGSFKAHCVLSFFKGALLKDDHGILEKPGPNSQAARVARFTGVKEVRKRAPVLKALLREAVAVEKAGQQVRFKKITEHRVPDALREKFDAVPGLETAFRALTPGRQRAYLLHFSSAKLPATRAARVGKCVKRILRGKGLGDREDHRRRMAPTNRKSR